MSKKKIAEKLNRLAIELEEDEKIEDAIRTYRKAIAKVPKWSVPYYNLGLLYKRKRDWENSLRYNRKAARLNPADQPAWWNMGIAATALSDWENAKEAWLGFGMNVPSFPKGAEIRIEIGITPVRLNESAEVVWVKRLDPARGQINNIPTAESNRRYHDIVLHDGVPNGERLYDGQRFHVFDEITLWQASKYKTCSIWVEQTRKSHLSQIEKWCEETDIIFENWTGTIRCICQQCSEGKPHDHHDIQLERNITDGEYHLAFASEKKEMMDGLLERMQQELGLEIIDLKKW